MPQIRYFEVEQTRSVKVEANSVGDAIRIAEIAFESGQTAYATVTAADLPSGIWGNTVSAVEVRSITAKSQ